jgi:hypothetical protein
MTTVGEQRLLVIAVGCNGIEPSASVLQRGYDLTLGDAGGSLNDVYRKLSWGQMWFAGQVVGVGIQAALNCDLVFAPGHPMWAIDDALRAKGIDLASYTRRLYSIPGFCTSADRGFPSLTVGGITFSASILSLGDGWGNIAHEMGHCLGMTHAGTWNPLSDRGDNGDLMGSGVPMLNAPHKMQLGWWRPEQVIDVTQEGDYTISHHVLANTGVMALRVGPWIVSYQQQLTDAIKAIYPSITGGASIHTLVNGIDTRLVDTHPNDGLAFLSAPLTDGSVFRDTANSIEIEQLSHTDREVRLRVRLHLTTPTPDPTPAPAPGPGKPHPPHPKRGGIS